jgi:hypothetical protein
VLAVALLRDVKLSQQSQQRLTLQASKQPEQTMATAGLPHTETLVALILSPTRSNSL